MGECWDHVTIKEVSHKRFYLYEISRIRKAGETESRLFPRAGTEVAGWLVGNEDRLPLGTGFPVRAMERF